MTPLYLKTNGLTLVPFDVILNGAWQMASPGMLVGTMARLMGMSEVYVAAFDRELAKHGLRNKGGRGTSAARMDSEDATNLLLSVLSGGQAKDAAGSVATYSQLRPSYQRVSKTEHSRQITFFDYRAPVDSLGLGLTIVDVLPVDHTLFDLVDALIFSAQNGSLEAAVGQRKVASNSGGLAMLGTWEIGVRLMAPVPSAEVTFGFDEMTSSKIYVSNDDVVRLGDLSRSMSISQNTLIGIGRLLRD